MQEYGETWRIEFDLELIADSSVFNTVIHVGVAKYIGGVGHPLLPKIEVKTVPTLELRVQCYQNGANIVKNIKLWYIKETSLHIAIEQVYDRPHGKFFFKTWLNDKLIMRVWNKEPQIFETAVFHFGGSDEDEVESLSSIVVKNIKLCNGKIIILLPKIHSYMQLLSYTTSLSLSGNFDFLHIILSFCRYAVSKKSRKHARSWIPTYLQYS